MSEAPPDPLAAERAAYLAASAAALDATLDAEAIQNGPPAPDKNERRLQSLRTIVERQQAALRAHDRFVSRAVQLGVDWSIIAHLREGRAELALGLQQIHAELHRGESDPAEPA